MLIFDIDGTLTDTVDVDGECFQESVRQILGLDLTDEWSSFEQVTDQGITDELLSQRTARERMALGYRLRQDFFERLGDRARRSPERFAEIPGAAELLQELDERAVDYALATGGWRPSAELKLAMARLPAKRLRATSSETSIRIQIFASAAAGRTNVTLLGDGLWDATVARRLGWRFVARAAPGAKSEALLQAGAEGVVHDWTELEEGLLFPAP
ncbi:MAG: HAD hydrolase-like protein [Acidobacteriota bacterium]